MSFIHVLGIGSPFGDDRLGWEVIERLQQQTSIRSLPAHVLKLISCDRPGIRLLELIKEARVALLIDAMRSGTEEGTIRCLKNVEIESCEDFLSSHNIGVAQALKLGRVLNDLPQEIILYGVEVNPVEWSNVLSAPIQKAIRKLVVILEHDIIQFTKKI